MKYKKEGRVYIALTRSLTDCNRIMRKCSKSLPMGVSAKDRAEVTPLLLYCELNLTERFGKLKQFPFSYEAKLQYSYHITVWSCQIFRV